MTYKFAYVIFLLYFCNRFRVCMKKKLYISPLTDQLQLISGVILEGSPTRPNLPAGPGAGPGSGMPSRREVVF